MSRSLDATCVLADRIPLLPRAAEHQIAAPRGTDSLSHVVTSRRREPFVSAQDAADLKSAVARIRSAHRVHIVGAPGSGKSTFAQHVSASSGVPVYSLDLIAYEGPDFKERSL